MQQKRSIHTLILLLSLSLPFLVVCLWFQSQVYYAKQHAKDIVANESMVDDVVTLKLCIAEAAVSLKWEHEQEFAYKGEMYDILKTEWQGDSVIYHCYHDSFESEVKRAYHAMLIGFAKSGQSSGQQEQHTVNFFKSLYIASSAADVELIHLNNGRVKAETNLEMYSDFILDKVSPPPQTLG